MLAWLFDFKFLYSSVFSGVFHIYMYKWPGVNVVDAVLPPTLCDTCDNAKKKKTVCHTKCVVIVVAVNVFMCFSSATLWLELRQQQMNTFQTIQNSCFYLLMLELVLHCYLSPSRFTGTLFEFQCVVFFPCLFALDFPNANTVPLSF